MCGIVAYKGSKNCFPILISGLKKLEYRGYDSAGVACILNDTSTSIKHKITTIKRVGKVRELENAINSKTSLKD